MRRATFIICTYIILYLPGSAIACGDRLNEEEFIKYTPTGSLGIRLDGDRTGKYLLVNQCGEAHLNVTDNANGIDIIMNNSTHCVNDGTCEVSPSEEQMLFSVATIVNNEKSGRNLDPGEYFRNNGWNNANFFEYDMNSFGPKRIKTKDKIEDFLKFHASQENYEAFQKEFGKNFHAYIKGEIFSWDFGDFFSKLAKFDPCNDNKLGCSYKFKLIKFTTTGEKSTKKPLKFHYNISLARRLQISTRSNADGSFNHSVDVLVSIPVPENAPGRN